MCPFCVSFSCIPFLVSLLRKTRDTRRDTCSYFLTRRDTRSNPHGSCFFFLFLKRTREGGSCPHGGKEKSFPHGSFVCFPFLLRVLFVSFPHPQKNPHQKKRKGGQRTGYKQKKKVGFCMRSKGYRLVVSLKSP